MIRAFKALAGLIALSFFCGYAAAQIPAPQINLSGNIGCQGFPCVNNGTLNMATDANRTVTAQETSALYIKVTSSVSLTATRSLLFPTGRFPVTIENATSGGQALGVCTVSVGATCLSTPIPNGTTTSVWNDGTNYVQIGSKLGTIYNQTIAVSGTHAPQESILNFIAGISGSVTNPTVTDGGTGYIGAPSVSFSGGSCTTEPTGSTTVDVDSGIVTSLVLITSGAGCISPPSVAFSGGGGTGAVATVTVVPDGISCVDNAGTTSTDCTMTFGGGGGSSSPITLNDVTTTRTFGAVYQNTTTTAMYVSGFGTISGGAGDSSGICSVGASSASLAVWATSFSFTIPGEAAGFACFVPAGYFYQVIMAGHINSAPGKWIEYLGFGASGGGGGGSSYFLGAPTVTVTGTSANHYVPVATDSLNAVMRQLTEDDILPAFAISTFTCSICGNVEAGVTTASPASGTASYTSVPVSAATSDGTNNDPMTTPFTSWSLAHTYCNVSDGISSKTFTLTAVGATTKTASQTINCTSRSFGGTGTGASATGATASGNNAVLVGATGTLTISYLGTSCTGQVYNVTTSGTQYVYLLLPCNVSNPGGGSFTTPGPTVFAMNAPTTITYVNQFGVSLASSYLYRSVNSSFSGTNYIITVGN